MTSRIIALFNLKPGTSRADYEAWARAQDIPTVNALASIDKFEVFRSTGLLGSSDAVPYDYIEIIDIADMGQFGNDVGSEKMQKIASDFRAMADVIFITTEKL